MRVYLTVQRNRLAPVNVVWTVPKEIYQGAAPTISRLLSSVDEVIPLKSDDWGLEDYVVHIRGFECLHFAKLSEALKDGDHVIIRPLDTADIRSRTLSGRHQVSAGGMTLVDGVPFGRPAFRSIDRPNIHIPTRKRRRVTLEDGDLVNWQQGRNGDSVSLSDADVNDESLLLVNSGEASLKEGRCTKRPTKAISAPKRVRFNQAVEDELEEDEEDDDEFLPDCDDESTEDEDSENGYEEYVELGTNVTQERPTNRSGEDDGELSKSSSESSSSDSSSSSNSELSGDHCQENNSRSLGFTSENQDGNRQIEIGDTSGSSSYIKPQSQAPPGAGLHCTKRCNQRKAAKKKLLRLKQTGLLGENANFEDLQALTMSTSNDNMDIGEEIIDDNVSAGVEKNGSAVSTLELQPKAAPPSKDHEFQARRDKLIAQLETGVIMVDEDEPPEELSSKPQRLAFTATAITAAEPFKETPPEDQPPQKHVRLDTGAARRLIFGGLGTRAPRNAAEAAEARERLGAPSQPKRHRSQPQSVAIEFTSEDVPLESDAWESRIILKAVECSEGGENIELSTPPYPFRQRWDPQQKLPSKRSNKKRRRNEAKYYEYDANTGEEYFGEDGYHVNGYDENYGENSHLNYDDEGEAANEVRSAAAQELD